MNRPLLQASGFQIAFFIFAVVFLAAPLHKYGFPVLQGDGSLAKSLDRLAVFAPAVLILLLVPSIRGFCVGELHVPVGKEKWFEVGLVGFGNAVLLPFAFVGGLALWYWFTRGEMGLARWVGDWNGAEVARSEALSLDGVVFTLVLATCIGPVVEELVFRGMLFRAWEVKWGWFMSMLATSAVFAAYHPSKMEAFASSMMLIALYRRTGSLRACILVHALHNLLLWYPLLGQFLFRKAGKETGEIELWTLHLAMLGVVAVVLPMYLWIARERFVSKEPPTVIGMVAIAR